MNIHDAVRFGDEGKVAELLENRENLYHLDKNGNTPLHVAAKSAGGTMVRLLLDSGAEINAVNDSGDTPLDIARKHQNELAEEALLEYGAQSNHTPWRTRQDFIKEGSEWEQFKKFDKNFFEHMKNRNRPSSYGKKLMEKTIENRKNKYRKPSRKKGF